MDQSYSPSTTSRAKDLSQWREDDDAGEFENDEARPHEVGLLVPDALSKRARAKRAVTSESWDDDFLFQHEPTPPATPRRSTSRTPSRASRPQTPVSSPPNQLHFSLPSSSSRPPPPDNYHSASSASTSVRVKTLGDLTNPSLDSLVSSIDWTGASDLDEPTLTLASADQGTPKPASRVSSDSPHRYSHRSTASTSTARPTTASPQRTNSLTRDSGPSRPTSHPGAPHPSPSRIPSNATTTRSETPSLTAGSLRSLASLTTTTGDELKTETEDDETEDERWNVATSPRPSLFGLKRYSQDSCPSPPISPTLKPSNSKRWRFSRSRKEPSETKSAGQQRSSGIFGRRTGPREPEEIVPVERGENDPLRRSGFPLQTRDAQFVVLGRRTRTSADKTLTHPVPLELTRPSHPGHSASPSVPTFETDGSRHRRDQTSRQPPSSASRPLSPLLSHAPSLSENPHDQNRSPLDGDTTEADFSEFSGDEQFHLPTRLSTSRRKSIARTPETSSSSRSPAISFDSIRPGSPVESILGDRMGRWNSSQVSFASSASAHGHHERRASATDTFATGYETTRPEDSVKSRKRKLVKKRPVPEVVESTCPPSLGIDEGVGRRPLLSAVSSRSSASSKPTLTQSSPGPSHARSPSLPFAQDSDLEAVQRPKFARKRSSTTPSNAGIGERGQVVDIEPDWLGIVPFPPSPRASPHPRDDSLPHSSPSPTSRRSLISRTVSGKSHPPVTSRTQAEAKAKRNSGGLSQSISNLLSRSASSLPLGGGGSGEGGKRAPSPAPSSKSGKSSRSLLSRSGSKKGQQTGAQVASETLAVPKSPSLSLLKKRSSALISSTQSPGSSVLVAQHSRDRDAAAGSSRRKAPSPSSPSFSSQDRTASRPMKPQAASSSVSVRKASPAAMRPSADHSRQSSGARGQLNTSFKMPRSPAVPLASPILSATPAAGTRSNGNPSSSAKLTKKESTLRTRSAQAGHRPSLSLSSIMKTVSPSAARSPRAISALSADATRPCSSQPTTPPDRPQTALGTDRSLSVTHAVKDEDLTGALNFALPRRNSLSDLRIPARITNAQQKIEEDLERVKQFAQGVEDLKALRRQYDQLLRVFVEPCSLASPRHSIDVSAALSNGRTKQGARRVDLAYSQWWEQARTLIDLGDGKPHEPPRTSPGNLASRRDRCISMAAESITSSHLAFASSSETETAHENSPLNSNDAHQSARDYRNLAAGGGSSTRKGLPRVPSASSIETDTSVGARQREMLRGVLAPSIKGASLPSRGPPSPRPGLAVLAPSIPTIKNTHLPPPPSHSSPPKRPPFSRQYPSAPAPPRASPTTSRRVSRVGISGIREFLMRLRHRAVEELANSVGTLPPPAPAVLSCPPSLVAGPSRRSVSDPTSRSITPSNSRRPTLSTLGRPVPAPASSSPRSHHESRSSGSGSGTEEDWDAELEVEQPGNATLSLRRNRTVSAGAPASATTTTTKAANDMMVLTTENMPQLLGKVKEVREQCETCVELLKSLTL